MGTTQKYNSSLKTQDRRVLKLRRKGLQWKAIAFKLKLSIDTVANAERRHKERRKS